MAIRGFIGIDAGTQGLSVVFTDEHLNPLGTGEGDYEMVSGLGDGCYEQEPNDWMDALQIAMSDLRGKLDEDIEVLSIGVSGQMHGEVLADEDGRPLGSARLWCDARNESEGVELTARFNAKMPKRITAARWLWTTRNQKAKAKEAKHMTTPAGWIAYRLTGEWKLGIGDAAGMFPIDQSTMSYDNALLSSFDELVSSEGLMPLHELLPTVAKAGEDGGRLSSEGASLMGLTQGIPVSPAEGDQPAALAGSLIANAGMVSCSFGTSVCANSVGDRPFDGVSAAIDHFCAVDGKPINMVFLRNGTTFMNTVVEMFGATIGGDRTEAFQAVIAKVLESMPNCGGVLALPFMDDEPGLGVGSGGNSMLVGLNGDNATPGNAVKAALLSTIFNMKIGSKHLDDQGFPRTEIVLTGGLTKTPELGQVLSDVFNTPVTLPESAEEGTAWGAALMAGYRYAIIEGETREWVEFISDFASTKKRRFEPNQCAVIEYEEVFERYQMLLANSISLLGN